MKAKMIVVSLGLLCAVAMMYANSLDLWELLLRLNLVPKPWIPLYYQLNTPVGYTMGMQYVSIVGSIMISSCYVKCLKKHLKERKNLRGPERQKQLALIQIVLIYPFVMIIALFIAQKASLAISTQQVDWIMEAVKVIERNISSILPECRKIKIINVSTILSIKSLCI